MSDKPLQKTNLYTLDSTKLIWELKEEKSEKENRGKECGRSESKRKGGNIKGTEKPHDIGMEIPDHGLYCKKLANQIWGFHLLRCFRKIKYTGYIILTPLLPRSH